MITPINPISSIGNPPKKLPTKSKPISKKEDKPNSSFEDTLKKTLEDSKFNKISSLDELLKINNPS